MITLACVYLACGVTDMRKGMAGLAMLVQQSLGADPFDGAVFAFRGRRAPQARFCIRFALSFGGDRLCVAPAVRADRAGIPVPAW